MSPHLSPPYLPPAEDGDEDVDGDYLPVGESLEIVDLPSDQGCYSIFLTYIICY